MYTYNTLIAALQNITSDNDSEFIAELPNIVRRAEARVLRDLDLELFETIIDNLVTTDGSREVALPGDVVMTTSLWSRVPATTRFRPVEERGYDYCLDYAPDEVLSEGRPKYYCEQLSPEIPDIVPPSPEISGYMVTQTDVTDVLSLVGLTGFDEETNFVAEPTLGVIYPEWVDWDVSPVVEGDEYTDMYTYLSSFEGMLTGTFTAKVFNGESPSWAATSTGDVDVEGTVPDGDEATVTFSITFSDLLVLHSGTVVLTATVGDVELVATLHINAMQFGS